MFPRTTWDFFVCSGQDLKFNEKESLLFNGPTSSIVDNS